MTKKHNPFLGLAGHVLTDDPIEPKEEAKEPKPKPKPKIESRNPRDCPHTDSKVLDTRPNPKGRRRRRLCMACGHRWTTYEVPAKEFKRLRGCEKSLARIKKVLPL